MFDGRSGRSIFSRPRPIDLAARRAGYNSLDLDLEAEYDEDEEDPELARRLGHNSVLFDAQEEHAQRPPVEDVPFSDLPQVVRVAPAKAAHNGDREDENVWAGLA
jgi:hypothetical protein